MPDGQTLIPVIDLRDQPVLVALMLNTVHLSTASAFANVLRTSIRFCHAAFFAIRNHASSAVSSSGCLAAASLSRLRLITCTQASKAQFANCEHIVRKMRIVKEGVKKRADASSLPAPRNR